MKKYILFLLTSLFLIGIVAAANTATLISPAANECMNGGTAYYLNATLDTNTFNFTNCTFYYMSAGDTSWTLIGSVVNNSALTCNMSWSTTALTDRLGMTFNITYGNITQFNITSDTSTGVSLDNGVPTASWGTDSIANNSNKLHQDNIYLQTGADSTIGITNCTFYFPNGSVTTTASSNACSTTSQLSSVFGVVSEGPFHYNFIVRDANGNTTTISTNRTVNILLTPGGGGSTGGGGTPSTTKPGITQESFFGEARAAGKGWFTAVIDTIINWFKGLFN